MKKLTFYIKKALSLPPDVVIKKVIEKFETKTSNFFQRYKDFNADTHINFDVPIIKSNFIDIKKLNLSNLDKKVVRYLSRMYLSHRFDLLGSGWVKNSYYSKALGVEGYKYDTDLVNVKKITPENLVETLLLKPHKSKSKHIIKYISKDYDFIDWQKDYKSGYRWNLKKWYKEQRYGLKLGVDIKVPWELARMQHLSQLAVFSLKCKDLKNKHILEFKNQILDFIAFNPPRMGVNWVCTMDVAIRAANMLIAYDIFSQIDEEGILDKTFKQIFSNSIYEHGLHIVNNLEYSEFLTSNHYLSNIVGLLFIGAYLDKEEWIAFAVSEIINEMKKEFYEDGGNFESSTSYHRLSGELMIYATALILRLMQEGNVKKIEYEIKNKKLKIIKLYDKNITKLPQWFIDRLYKIGRFTVDITKPSGEIPQFGDNDSGRFIKLSPNGEFLTNKEAEEKYENLRGYNTLIKDYGDKEEDLFWDENILNHKTFVGAINGLFYEEIFETEFQLEKCFVEALSNGVKLRVIDKTYKKFNTSRLKIDEGNLKYKKQITHKLPFSISKYQLSVISYPNSGIFIFKNDKFYLAVCATPLGQNDNGGHTHNDKLGYELWIDGKDIVKDPGTYLYTPLPHRRNEFRSTKAHPVPVVDNFEQNRWLEGKDGLFGMLKESECKVIDIGKNFIKLYLKHSKYDIIREIEISNDRIAITDKCNRKFYYNKFNKYSNGYGKIVR